MASTANKNATTANKTVKSAIKKRKTEKITKLQISASFSFIIVSNQPKWFVN